MYRFASATVALALATTPVQPAIAQLIFGEPMNLGPRSSSGDYAPSLSNDGLTLYTHDGANPDQLRGSSRTATTAPFGPPEILEGINDASFFDARPRISADDHSLLFDSDRPDGQGGFDLWLASRENGQSPWQVPVSIGGPINSEANELAGDISGDGLTLVFARADAGPLDVGTPAIDTMDIYMAERLSTSDPWNEPVRLGDQINASDIFDSAPTISNDGLWLFFYSARDFDQSSVDIFYTWRANRDARWQPAVRAPSPVNTDGSEGQPFVTHDGLSLLYAAAECLDCWNDYDVLQSAIDLQGDYNGNRQVEQGDLDLVLLGWGEDASSIPATWTVDPATGAIDQDELDRVLLNWGLSLGNASMAPATIPEPSSWTLLAVLISAGAVARACKASGK